MKNDGNQDIENIRVEDVLAGSVTAEDGGKDGLIQKLAPGESKKFTAVYTVTEKDIRNGKVKNTASASGKDPNGNEISASGEAVNKTVAENEEVEVSKTIKSKPRDGKAFDLGEAIKYEIRVKNIGNVTIGTLHVADELTGDTGTNGWGVLNLKPGDESEIFTTKEYIVTEEDIVKGTVVNTAAAKDTVTGKSWNSEAVEAPIAEKREEVEVTKTIVSQPENGKAYDLGEAITYEIKVKNIGNVTIEKLHVTDKLTGNTGTDGWGILNLKPGGERSSLITKEYIVTEEDIIKGTVVNTASAKSTVTGKSWESEAVEAPIAEKRETVEIAKTIVSQPEDGIAYDLGETIEYEIKVKNTGNVTMKKLHVEDELTGNTGTKGWGINGLKPGAESEVFTARYTVTEEDIVRGDALDKATVLNKATVKNPDTGDVLAVDEIEAPIAEKREKIELTKTIVSQPEDGLAYDLGETIEYEIKVKNIGNVTMAKLHVEDALTGNTGTKGWGINGLKPGAESETFTTKYTVRESDILAGMVRNKASVKNPDTGSVLAETNEIAPTAARKPSLFVEKTAEEKEGGYALGEEISYNIKVINNGNVSIKNIVLEDGLTGDKWNIGSLAPKGSGSKSVTHKVTESEIIAGEVLNEAKAEGKDPDGNSVTGSGSAVVKTENIRKTLDVEKQVVDKKDVYQIGDTVKYSITVKNTGNVTQKNISVADAISGKGDLVITDVAGAKGKIVSSNVDLDTLTPGDQAVISCEYEVVKEDRNTEITNTAYATGEGEQVMSAVSVKAAEVYDIHVVHRYADGEADGAGAGALPEDYVIENLAPGEMRELAAEAGTGYVAYPNALEAEVFDQDVTIIFTYYKDAIGTENPDASDNIPDRFQRVVRFAAENGSVDKELAVVTLLGADGKPAESGVGHLAAGQIAAAMANIGYNQMSLSWTPGVPTVFYDITGEMTFTAAFTPILEAPAATPAAPAAPTLTPPAAPAALAATPAAPPAAPAGILPTVAAAVGDIVEPIVEAIQDAVANVQEVIRSDDDEVALANQELEQTHDCCALHLLILFITVIGYAFYTKMMKSQQKKLFEIREELDTELAERGSATTRERERMTEYQVNLETVGATGRRARVKAGRN